jgi:hypothetical protein
MMKKTLCHTRSRMLFYPLTALATIGLSAPLQAETSVQLTDISGNWTANGYTCDAETLLEEKIKIEKNGDVFTAIKMTGDNCIPAGYETFHWDTSRNLCQILGIKTGSTFVYDSCTVEIVDENNFKVIVPDDDNYTFSFQKESELPVSEIDITGVWITEVSCYDVSQKPERIKIEKNGAVFTGVKLTGDDCVPAGYMTFFWDSNTDICQATGAEAPLTPPSIFFKCNMSMVDENHFKLIYPDDNFEEIYRREGGASQSPPVLSDNLNIEIPYAEFRASPDNIRLIQGELEFVPTDDGLLWWKLLDNHFLSE